MDSGPKVLPVEPPSSLDAIVGHIHDVSSFPAIAARVIDTANDEKATIGDLKRIVESDPALTARLLRTVNSSAYGVRRHITTLHDAIIYLGFGHVRNLAMTASIAEIFRKEEAVGTYRRRSLWKHLVSVGLIARKIALRCGIARFEEAFLCGVLHDLGIILLDQYLHRQFVAVVKDLVPGVPLCEVERRITGFDHAELGAAVAHRWEFPRTVVTSIRHHHDATAAEKADQTMTAVVEIANFITAKMGITSMGIDTVTAPKVAVFAALSLGRDDLEVLWDDLAQELDTNQAVFDI